MLEWISRHSELVSALLNFGMLMVWVVYLQVFVSNYRRQTRPHILINMGSGSGLAARCLVSNMSSDAIYINSIILRLETADEVLSCPVTEIDGFEDWHAPSDLNLWTRQGPLGAGQVRDMGSFEVMVDHALRSRTGGEQPDPALRDAVRNVTVNIIAVYGSEDLPIAADRRFDVIRDDGAGMLRPDSVSARQIRSRRHRRGIRRRLERDLQQSGP